MNDQETQIPDKKSTKDRLNFIFFILVLSATVAVIITLRGAAFVEGLRDFNGKNIIVEASNWDIPIFISLPCFLALITALLLRLLDLDSQKRIQRCVKFALAFSLAAIVIRLPYGFFVKHSFEKNGYTPCWELSSPAIFSPTIWVKHRSYCIQNSGSVRKEIIDWINDPKNKNVSPDELRKKTHELLNAYDMEQLTQ